MFSLLQNFRQNLYELISKRAAATLDLIDALSSHNGLSSVTKLSLSPFFRRKYNSITKVIKEFKLYGKKKAPYVDQAYAVPNKKKFLQLTGEFCSQPKQRDFFLFGTDVTPALRPYADKLEDRGIVYQPTTTPGNKPIGVGHAYSLLACLPEKQSSFPWLLPLDISRVETGEKGHEVGIDQFLQWMEVNEELIQNKDCVNVADSSYPTQKNQEKIESKENAILISRIKSNRNVYEPCNDNTRKKYGNQMKLNDPISHIAVDEEMIYCIITKRGKRYQVEIKCWYDMVRRGSRTFKGYEHPFNLYQCVLHDPETNREIYKRPLWLTVYGQNRSVLSPDQVYASYAQRYDLEHFFRFAKQHLLIDSFQTPKVVHEEHWWEIAQIAYLQLYLARTEITSLPHPWERYLPEYKTKQEEASPSQVKRIFNLVLNQIGTPAHDVLPVTEGKGRQKGEVQKKRHDQAIVIKSSKKENQKKKRPPPPPETERVELWGLDKLSNELQTPKFDELLELVADFLKKSKINVVDFIEKLKESEGLAR